MRMGGPIRLCRIFFGMDRSLLAASRHRDLMKRIVRSWPGNCDLARLAIFVKHFRGQVASPFANKTSPGLALTLGGGQPRAEAPGHRAMGSRLRPSRSPYAQPSAETYLGVIRGPNSLTSRSLGQARLDKCFIRNCIQIIAGLVARLSHNLYAGIVALNRSQEGSGPHLAQPCSVREMNLC